MVVVGATSAPSGGIVCDLPLMTDPKFTASIIHAAQTYNCTLLWPGNDDAVVALAYVAEETPGLRCIGPTLAQAKVLRQKSLTYEWLRGHSWVPRSILLPDLDFDVTSVPLPVFCKPDKGSGGLGTSLCSTREQLAAMPAGTLACEVLCGPEATVDAIADTHGRVTCTARARLRIVDGQAQDTEIFEDDALHGIAHACAASLDLRGTPFFVQAKRRTNHPDSPWVLLEVAARLGGSSEASAFAGVNYALAAALVAAGHSWLPPLTYRLTGLCVSWKDGWRAPPMFKGRLPPLPTNLWVDMDDTLLDGSGHLRLAIATLVVAAASAGVVCGLCTRSDPEHVSAVLPAAAAALPWRLCQCLPDRDTPKPGLDTDCHGHWLLDDSFRERQMATAAVGVLAFDTHQTPLLIAACCSGGTILTHVPCVTWRDALVQPNTRGVQPAFHDVLGLAALRKSNRQAREYLVTRLPSRARVLEVGPCADSRGWCSTREDVDLLTLDVDTTVPANFHGDVGRLREIIGADDSGFDAVLLQDVLEHAGVRTQQIFKEIVAVLRPGGVLIVSGPFNFRQHGPAVDACRVTEHGFRFLADTFGLKIIALTSSEHALRPLCPIHTSLIVEKTCV